MDRIVLDLLKFYQKEMAETKEAAKALKRLNLTPETVSHYQLGYSTGAAFKVAGKEQRKALRILDMANNGGDRFKDSIVMPVYTENGTLADLFGIKVYKDQRKYVTWQSPPQGLIGVEVFTHYPEIILTDIPLYGLHVLQQGYANIVTLRDMAELDKVVKLVNTHDIQRVYIISHMRFSVMQKKLAATGVEIIKLPTPKGNVEKKHLAVVGTLPLRSGESAPLKLLERNASRLVFDAKGMLYRLDSLSLAGLGLQVQIRAEKNGQSFRDKVDLASATQRRKFARACGMKLGRTAGGIEDELSGIADTIDNLQIEHTDAQTKHPRRLKRNEKETALTVLQKEDVLQYQSSALEKHLHFIGEDANRKLALLIAASRLLDKPLGAILRGPAGCGKSALIQKVTQILPVSEVLYLSRMTSQSLFFMPREQLQNKLLVVDEYEGMQQAEYAIRTMMSSQTLSLAITLREGGRVPVTKTLEIPAVVAILVSTTGAINAENLSRFIELRMDGSPEQNERVIQALAAQGQGDTGFAAVEREIQNLSQLLQPCTVRIPYADKLIYKSGNVLSRRQFSQVVGLIGAHAALHQYQRESHTENKALTVTASKEDYKAVYPLLASVVDNFEEDLSPSSLQLLDTIQERKTATFTRKQVMDWLGWPYSRAYKVLRELTQVDLLMPDTMTNGIERTYAAAPYFKTKGGISHIAPPELV